MHPQGTPIQADDGTCVRRMAIPDSLSLSLLSRDPRAVRAITRSSNSFPPVAAPTIPTIPLLPPASSREPHCPINSTRVLGALRRSAAPYTKNKTRTAGVLRSTASPTNKQAEEDPLLPRAKCRESPTCTCVHLLFGPLDLSGRLI
eukprot:1176398-Prorocentrum_minimum.AAC.2